MPKRKPNPRNEPPPKPAPEAQASPARHSAPPPACPPKRDNDLLLAAGLIAATFLAYLPALFAGYVWDDDRYVTGNISLESPSGLLRIWLQPMTNTSPYPMVFTSFWLDYRLWGLNPAGYHAVNILFHAINSILFGMILLRARIPGARLAAAIFALHPVHAESVAWITERKDMVSGLFYFLSLLAWLRYLDSRARRDWAVSLALFSAGMLSKTVVCSMPVAALLLAWRRDPRDHRRDFRASIPFFVVGLALAATTIWWERHRTGATDEAVRMAFSERLLMAGRAPWFYLSKVLWPGPLMTIYPRWELGASAAQWAFPALTLAGCGALVLARRRLGDAPALAGAFFVATLGPALGFFNFSTMIYTLVSDHYQYLASGGAIALVAALAAAIGERVAIPARWRMAAAAAPLAALAVATWQQAALYKDNETLFTETIRKNPKAWSAYLGVGINLDEKGQTEKAVEYYLKALALKPNYAKALLNLGVARRAQGRPDEARQCYLKALDIDPRNPRLLSNLGALAQEQGKIDEAELWLQRALEADPHHAESLINMGFIRLGQKRRDEAAEFYARALEANPRSADALNHMGSVRLEQGRLDEAADYFTRAIEVKPAHDQALANLALTRLRQGREAEAIEYYRRAAAANPAMAGVLDRLGFAKLRGAPR